MILCVFKCFRIFPFILVFFTWFENVVLLVLQYNWRDWIGVKVENIQGWLAGGREGDLSIRESMRMRDAK